MDSRREALLQAGFGDWGDGMWYKYLGGMLEDPCVIYDSEDDQWDDGKIGVRIPIDHFAKLFKED